MKFSLSDFLTGDFDPELQTALKDIEAFPAHLIHCMLSGPPRSGKTSILLQYAYKAAMRGQQVVLLCHRDKMEQTHPTLPQGVHKASPFWQRVQLRYLPTSQELQKYAACLHLAPTPPNVIIVDDLSEFMLSRPTDKRSREAELIKTLAMLHEATASLHRLNASGQPCLLLISDAGGGEGPKSLYILERWCPLILTTQNAEGKLTLSALPAMAEKHLLHPSCFCQLHFSLTTHSALTLEGLSWP
ncbi:hypothetical protein WJX77_000290 [Trebouxia sp. C0004]